MKIPLSKAESYPILALSDKPDLADPVQKSLTVPRYCGKKGHLLCQAGTPHAIDVQIMIWKMDR